MNQSKFKWQIIIALVCLVYILLRFWRLTDSCLWFDEIFGVHAAAQDWGNLFWFVAQDLIHPPLFYVLLKIWISVGGESLFWLRFFSVLFAILSIVPFYFLCRQLKIGYPATAIALAFLAANGALIKYAQEVRMYALLMFFALFSMWLFTRFLHLGKNIWILTVVNVLLVYTHYFGWFVVLAEVLAILILQRIKIRQILIMFGICLLSFAPWLFTVFRASQINTDLAQNIGWIGKPDFYALFNFAFDLIEPFYFQTSNAEAASNYLISIPILIIIAAAKIFYLLKYSEETEIEKRDFWMLGFFIATPIFIALIASWILPYSIWGTRHLITVFAPAAILIGVFFDKLKPQILKIILISALFLLFLAAFIYELNRPKQEFVWCAWENLAQNVDKNQPQKIYVFEDLIAYHFWFALRENENAEIIKIDNVEGVFEDKAYFLPRGFDGVKNIDFNQIEDKRFFVAFRDKDWNLQNPPLKNLVEKGYKIGEPQIIEAQGLKAFLFEVRTEK
jgi:uncharacterized membrane protein